MIGGGIARRIPMTGIRTGTSIACLLASIAIGAGPAAAADRLKLAVGQCGNWDSSMVELGIRTGAYARRGLEVEALCTQGMDALMVEGVNFKYLAKPLTPEELREFVQVPLR
jgi:ABC-type nitrate/sulfonate/bicarbonate transport system substrate-binding protein